MKKIFHLLTPSFFIILCAVGLNSCVKDSMRRAYTYKYYEPVYKTRAEVKSNIKSSAPQEVENPGKIVILGNYIFLNEVDKGVHVIDNNNPASPRNIAFINIPGNMDIAVKGNVLYADLYTDLVTLDISDPLNIIIKKYNEGVFPYRMYSNGFYNDSSKIITQWIEKDTTVTENLIRPWNGNVYYDYSSQALNFSSSSSGKSNAASPIGKGGSMARFALVDNRMYTVSNADINVFNITNAQDPVFSKKVNIGTWNVETIFPFKNKLFIGSQNGMFMYSINNPDAPSLLGTFAHVQSCDPVIADDNYAYVTLRTGTTCMGNTNELDVLQLNNFVDPSLVKSYSLTNPYGLSKDGDLLFICDGSDGLKVYNASNVNDLKLIKHFTDIETYDVITLGRIALVVAKDGLYQFDYADKNNIRVISKIDVLKK